MENHQVYLLLPPPPFGCCFFISANGSSLFPNRDFPLSLRSIAKFEFRTNFFFFYIVLTCKNFYFIFFVVLFKKIPNLTFTIISSGRTFYNFSIQKLKKKSKTKYSKEDNECKVFLFISISLSRKVSTK